MLTNPYKLPDNIGKQEKVKLISVSDWEKESISCELYIYSLNGNLLDILGHKQWVTEKGEPYSTYLDTLAGSVYIVIDYDHMDSDMQEYLYELAMIQSQDYVRPHYAVDDLDWTPQECTIFKDGKFETISGQEFVTRFVDNKEQMFTYNN